MILLQAPKLLRSDFSEIGIDLVDVPLVLPNKVQVYK
jgi:hypothetical protein